MPRYEITKENVVLVWYDETSEEPGLLQPFDPQGNGSAFASKAAATTWAEAHLELVAASEAALDEAAVVEEPVTEEPAE